MKLKFGSITRPFHFDITGTNTWFFDAIWCDVTGITLGVDIIYGGGGLALRTPRELTACAEWLAALAALPEAQRTGVHRKTIPGLSPEFADESHLPDYDATALILFGQFAGRDGSTWFFDTDPEPMCGQVDAAHLAAFATDLATIARIWEAGEIDLSKDEPHQP